MAVKFNNVQKFRAWLRQELDKVNLIEVMQHIDEHLAHDDAILLGFSASLAFLANAYRWGTIPITEVEVKRAHLDFPEKLWTPFEQINDFYGLVQRGNSFTLNAGNCIYEDVFPADMRFCFNADPHIVKSEKNFFLSFLHMETAWKPALQMMAEYLTLTENARQAHDNAEQLLGQRVKLLKDIKKIVAAISRLFHKYMRDNVISVDFWAHYVQCMPAWNVNGIAGGATGSEFMTFHSLDEFLGTLGKGAIYHGGIQKRSGAPLLYRICLEALADESRSYRFDSFLQLPEDSDPLQKAKDDLISMLYTWRLHHAKVAPRYQQNSIITAGGTVDQVKNRGETIEMRSQMELRERARETAEYISKDCKGLQVTSKVRLLDSIWSTTKTTNFICSVLFVCILHYLLMNWFL